MGPTRGADTQNLRVARWGSRRPGWGHAESACHAGPTRGADTKNLRVARRVSRGPGSGHAESACHAGPSRWGPRAGDRGAPG
eukprot:7372848-Pyramimonas_sp.AAC.1